MSIFPWAADFVNKMTDFRGQLRLRLAEAESRFNGCARWKDVRRLASSPLRDEFLRDWRRYDAEPIVMPADWVPDWRAVLGGASVADGVARAIGDDVEVQGREQ